MSECSRIGLAPILMNSNLTEFDQQQQQQQRRIIEINGFSTRLVRLWLRQRQRTCCCRCLASDLFLFSSVEFGLVLEAAATVHCVGRRTTQ